MIGLLLAALLTLPAQAGEWNSACFSGLNDADSPATLPNCESPDLLNVESNLDGTAILKRKGFSKSADLTISTGPVTGSHSFIDSSGNRLDIVCQDKNCAKSTNGNAFTTFLTTAGGSGAAPKRWSFVDVGGYLYGANDRRDLILKYDGTTRTSLPLAPQGSILELTQDRMVVGDIASLPNRVHFSSAGAYEQFTTGVNPEDSFFDEVGTAGDRVRGIKCLQGNCFIFKTASITLCEMADQYNTQCSVISPNIGTTDPASIVAAGADLYFRAQDKSYWKIGRNGLEQISKKIPALVKSQSGGLGGGEQTNTQTTKADWDAGFQLPSASWNTASINGSIFPSSTTKVYTSSADFSGGTLTNLSVSDVDGSLTMSSNTLRDTFADGDYTTGATTWTVTAGSWLITEINGNNYLLPATDGVADQRIHTTGFSYSSGSWAFDYQCFNSAHNCVDGVNIDFQFRFFRKLDDYYFIELQGVASRTVLIKKMVSSTETSLTSADVTAYTSPLEDHTFDIDKTTDGRIYLHIDGVFISSTTDTAITGNGYTEIRSGEVSATNLFRNFNFYVYQSSGLFLSSIYDTTFSTPVGGPMSSTYTLPSVDSQVNFYVRSSSSPNNDMWGSAVASSDTLRISQVKRYWQTAAYFQNKSSTGTIAFQSESLTAATTGQFVSQCIQPNATITAWGTLSCAETTAGGGSIVYYATSAVTCAALPVSTAPVNAGGAVQAGWLAQTNNATLTVPTNSAVFIGWRSLLGSTTDQAEVDACVLTWTDGTPSQPAWGVFDSVKQAVYWTSTINGAVTTNRLLKYDLNLDQWYPFDIPAQAPKVINNTLYFGGASSGTWNAYGLVDADVGNSIRAFWKSKDVGSDSPFVEKDFKTLSILSRNSGTGSMTGTWTLSNAQTGSYTISLATGTGISYARSNYNLPLASPQQFLSIQVGNNNSTPFEVLGIGLTWMTRPWRVSGP